MLMQLGSELFYFFLGSHLLKYKILKEKNLNIEFSLSAEIS